MDLLNVSHCIFEPFSSIGTAPAPVSAASIREAVAIFLSSSPTVLNFPIYPERIPETGTYPNVVYELTDHTKDYDLDGFVGFERATFDITISSKKKALTDAIAVDVKDLLNGFRGRMSGLFITFSHLLDAQDDESDPVDGSDDAIYEITQSWRFGINKFL